MGHVQISSVIQAPVDEVFEYLADYSNRKEILPTEDIEIELLSPVVPMKKGVEFKIELKRYGFNYPFTYIIEDFESPHLFIEKQTGGIFEEWNHIYKFEKHSENTTLITNIVEFKLPLGIIGTLVDDLFAKQDVRKLLEKCHANIQKHFSK